MSEPAIVIQELRKSVSASFCLRINALSFGGRVKLSLLLALARNAPEWVPHESACLAGVARLCGTHARVAALFSLAGYRALLAGIQSPAALESQDGAMLESV